MNEIFKPVEGYEGLYEVSNLARVRNLKTSKYISGMKSTGKYSNGYTIIALCKDRHRTQVSLRHLVAKHFLPDYHENCQVRLIDSSKGESADNLTVMYSIKIRCRVMCIETGEIFESLTDLSRSLCGDKSLKSTLSNYIHANRPYKGNHYLII